MKYMLNTSFQQMDEDNNILGKFELHSHVETEGYFDNGLSLYKVILESLLDSLECYESEVKIYGR